jgi:hypothetical protein
MKKRSTGMERGENHEPVRQDFMYLFDGSRKGAIGHPG